MYHTLDIVCTVHDVKFSPPNQLFTHTNHVYIFNILTSYEAMLFELKLVCICALYGGPFERGGLCLHKDCLMMAHRECRNM